MKEIINDFSTQITMTGTEAKEICKRGQGEACCAFLAFSSGAFECIRLSYPANTSIFSHLKDGSMSAKGEGGWYGCAWEGEINQKKEKL